MRRWTREWECGRLRRPVVHVRAEPGVGLLRVSLTRPLTTLPPNFFDFSFTRSITVMAIEVRVPTILRSYTGGSKVVEGAGDTLSGLIDDLDAKHSGLKGRLLKI